MPDTPQVILIAAQVVFVLLMITTIFIIRERLAQRYIKRQKNVFDQLRHRLNEKQVIIMDLENRLKKAESALASAQDSIQEVQEQPEPVIENNSPPEFAELPDDERKHKRRFYDTDYVDHLDEAIERVKSQYVERFHHQPTDCRTVIENDRSLEEFIYHLRLDILSAECAASRPQESNEYWSIFAKQIHPFAEWLISQFQHNEKDTGSLDEAENSDSDDTPDPFDTSSDDIEELRERLERANKRIKNLETYKRLFLELQKQVRETHKETTDLNQQIEKQLVDSDENDEVIQLLRREREYLEQLGYSVGEVESAPKFDTIAQLNNEHANMLSNALKRSEEELRNLKKANKEQFETIMRLKTALDKIEDSGELDSKSEATQEATKAMEKLEISMRDQDMCIKMLEEENEAAHERIVALETKISNMEEEVKQNDQLRNTMQQFTRDSQEMMSCIAVLESEIEEIREQKEALEEELIEAQKAASQAEAQDDDVLEAPEIEDIDIDAIEEAETPEIAENVEVTEDTEAGENIEDSPAEIAEQPDDAKQQIETLEASLATQKAAYENLLSEYTDIEKKYLEIFEAQLQKSA